MWQNYICREIGYKIFKIHSVRVFESYYMLIILKLTSIGQWYFDHEKLSKMFALLPNTDSDTQDTLLGLLEYSDLVKFW